MRVLSWNINGIRTLPQYHPWNAFKSCEGILDHLQADIICFQEMKSSRAALPKDVALPGHFDSFFSFPLQKGGYSGVAVYTKSNTVLPLKAEEGLTGRLLDRQSQTKNSSDGSLLPSASDQERISSTYPVASSINLMPEEEGGHPPRDLLTLDTEGRTLILDFGLFVLINLYCPNLTSEARLPYKMNFHRLLQERVRLLVEVDKREVLVLGDINVCLTPLDHCDGHLPSVLEGFLDSPWRIWMKEWLEPDGIMVDVVRKFWPERKGMFTCWNTKINARETNYGTRIDYILVTPGLVPWLKYADIQPSVKGSDHCPVYVDLHEEIELDGKKISLRDVMSLDNDDGRKDLPRLAAKYWDEFSGKQTLLSNFFGKGGATKQLSENKSVTSALRTRLDETAPIEPSKSLALALSQGEPQTELVSTTPSSSQNGKISSPVKLGKRKHTPAGLEQSSPPSPAKRSNANTVQKQKIRPQSGQTKLSAFFSKPVDGRTQEKQGSHSPASMMRRQPNEEDVIFVPDSDDIEEVDDPDPPSSPETSFPSSSQPLLPGASQSPKRAQSKSKSKSSTWAQLMAPIQAPMCFVHREPTQEYTVKKQGPNKGKNFFLCSRPVGPGYDKGKSERLREEVDSMYRCNFFQWSSDVKRATLKTST